jgi:trimethylamine--corrinoid protein Co-methyltransferase
MRCARWAPAATFLGCAHTQANFRAHSGGPRCWITGPFETWAEDGGKSSYELAADRVRKLLGDYQAPQLDPAIDEALRDYMDRRKAEMPDAFI